MDKMKALEQELIELHNEGRAMRLAGVPTPITTWTHCADVSVRFQINAAHTEADIENVLEVLGKDI